MRSDCVKVLIVSKYKKKSKYISISSSPLGKKIEMLHESPISPPVACNQTNGPNMSDKSSPCLSFFAYSMGKPQNNTNFTSLVLNYMFFHNFLKLLFVPDFAIHVSAYLVRPDT